MDVEELIPRTVFYFSLELGNKLLSDLAFGWAGLFAIP